MMTKYPFNIVWSEEDGEYMATCPAFPGLSAFGETEEEALSEAKVALGLFIESFNERGIPLPDPHIAHAYSGQFRVRLPKSLHAQAAQMAEADGTSLNQFISDAVRAKVAGERVGERCVDEVKRLVASLAWEATQPKEQASRVVRFKLTEVTTETPIPAPTLSVKKGN